jgi:hypothetical protein
MRRIDYRSRPDCGKLDALAGDDVSKERDMFKRGRLAIALSALCGAITLAAMAGAAAADRAVFGYEHVRFCAGPCGCRPVPDPYWDGPVRVQRPHRDWRHCYWHQQWW